MLEIEWSLALYTCFNPNFYYDPICYSKEEDAIIDLARAIKGVDSNKNSFSPFALSFSTEDLNLNTDYWDYYGQSGNTTKIQDGLIKFITEHTQNGDPNLARNIINNIDYMLKSAGYKYMNIKIHVGDDYPVWHIDKSFDEVITPENSADSSIYSHSFIFTLKGKSTLFLPTNDTIRKNFYSIAQEEEFTYEAQNISSIADLSTKIEAKAAVFMRSSKLGSIHSAPEGLSRMVFVVSPLLEETYYSLNEFFDNKNRNI